MGKKDGVVTFIDFVPDKNIPAPSEKNGDDQENQSEKEKSLPGKRFTKRQWICLVIFGTINLLSSMTVSLQAPFYPAEAERKGATATEYGFVFGIFEFVIFLTSPIYGKYVSGLEDFRQTDVTLFRDILLTMNRLGPKAVYSTCILLTSVSLFCFGLLDRIEDHTWFITLCFICRIFEALGASGFITATIVFVACEFPDSVATTFALLETVIGLGFISGPTLGAILYELGGFSLPFFVVGSLLLLMGMLSCFIMPDIQKEMNAAGEEHQGYSIWKILKIPSVFLCALCVASTDLGMGFLNTCLEPHLRQFNLTTLQIGLVFIVNTGVYGAMAPIAGYLCDRISRPVYICVVGNFIIFAGFALIGPADFIPSDTMLWMILVGLAILGLGQSCTFVSSFLVGLKECTNYGMPDNLSTYAVVSGLWQSMISLGAWVGPSTGGFLFDTVGFREGSWLVMATSLIVGVAMLVHTCITPPSSAPPQSVKNQESQPLLLQQHQIVYTTPSKSDGFEKSCEVKPSSIISYGSNF